MSKENREGVERARRLPQVGSHSHPGCLEEKESPEVACEWEWEWRGRRILARGGESI